MKNRIHLFRRSALAALLVLTLVLSGGCSVGLGPDLPFAASTANEAAGGSDQAGVNASHETSAGDAAATEDAEQAGATVEPAEASDAQVPASETKAPQTEGAVPASETRAPQTEAALTVDRDGHYDSVEEVALYLHLYGELPDNYITKKEAQKLGWEGGSLENYARGCAIGGSYFGNYEGILPSEDEYHECDIDTVGKKSRGARRIVYSEDGDIYYTEDHYESFLLLYTAEGPAEKEIRYR